MLPLLLSAALAAPTPPASFEEGKSGGGCTIYAGPKDSAGFSKVWALCAWPDVSVEKLDALLSDWSAHATYFSAVSSAQCVTEGTTGYCRHRNVASGISDREIDLVMTRAQTPQGLRFAWQPAPSQSAPTGGAVQAIDSTGAWHISANPAGGAWATYELYYNPGGSVPSLLVRWFQGSGILTLTEELHDYATR